MSSGASAASGHEATKLVFYERTNKIAILVGILQRYCKCIFTLFRNANESMVSLNFIKKTNKNIQ